MFFYVVSTQVPTGTPARIKYTDGTVSTFAASSPAFQRVPETGTIIVTSASCTGCTYEVATNACPVPENVTETANVASVPAPAAPSPAPVDPPAPPPLPIPPPAPDPVAAAPPAMTCFSGDSLVRLDDGKLKRMDELETNDWVLAVEGSRVGPTQLPFPCP